MKWVTGKENILFKVAGAALGQPGDSVRKVIFPAVSGGEQTLRDLVHEFKTKGPAYRTTVQTTLRASYTNHGRGRCDRAATGHLASLTAWHLDPAAGPAALPA
ncbi:hypothetical protein MF672_050585 (plasmid) [Actinomadura sp. ATCC 31491]|uniref:Uncharacterized protein n=1 Tax=Actinomadura luzonensis TaxID=2805427 RepID=A0ABT0GBL2_9ACTN|nr:hypothetical protein [Actinomadura luzonensis]MCK2222005.1 hypothetical protein [Actinomadura luzonensis]